MELKWQTTVRLTLNCAEHDRMRKRIATVSGRRVASWPTFLLATATLVSAPWCAGQESESDVGGDTDTVITDAGPDIPNLDPVEVDEDFRVIYGYAATAGDRPGDLGISNPLDGEGQPGFPAWKDNFQVNARILAPLGLDCSLGCVTEPALNFLLVATTTGVGTPGQDARLIAIDETGQPTIVTEQPIPAVRQAVFSGRSLYVSRVKNDCESKDGGIRTCYRFGRIDLDDPVFEIQELFEFPGPDLAGRSNYTGRFRLGADGVTLVLQNLELESLTFYLFNEKAGLRKAGVPVCQAIDLQGKCMYSQDAPQLSDDIPAILSADGRTLLFAHVFDARELRLAKMDVESGSIESVTLVRTPSRYASNACYNLNRDWPYTSIMQPLLLSRDGRELIVAAASTCDGAPGKTWANILAFSVNDIGTDANLTNIFRKITDFPKVGAPEMISVSPDSMSLSPSGRFLSFVGTAIRDSSGQPLTAATQQHLIDREVFVTSTESLKRPIQISGNLDYRATFTMCSVANPGFSAFTDPLPVED